MQQLRLGAAVKSEREAALEGQIEALELMRSRDREHYGRYWKRVEEAKQLMRRWVVWYEKQCCAYEKTNELLMETTNTLKSWAESDAAWEL